MSSTLDLLKDAIVDKQKDTALMLLADYNKTGLLGTGILHLTCRNGWLDVVKYLIEEKGLDLLEKDTTHGATPLHFACTSGSIELVKYLIVECRCDHLLITDDHFTTLHCAVMGGIGIVTYLMESFHTSDILSQRTQTLMRYVYYIWSNNDNKLVKYLLTEKHFSNVINSKTGNTMLHYSCRERKIKQLKFLIDDCNCNPHVLNYNGDTLLHAYCSTLTSQKENLKMLSFIYQLESPTNNPLTRNFADTTPLDYAIMHKEMGMETLTFLINKCSLNTNDCIHVLSTAYYYWNDSIIKCLLVENKCGFITSVETGDTLLHRACRDNCLERLQFLIEECDGDPHDVNANGDTLLHALCKSFHKMIDIKILTYLCTKCQCNPFLMNAHDRTALEYAIEGGDKGIAIVRCLIEQHGCDALFKGHGVHIISLAYKYWNNELMKYLVLTKNYTTVVDDYTGETLLHKACKTRKFTKIKFLIEECKCNPHVIDNKGNTLVHVITNSLNKASGNELATTCIMDYEILRYLCNECSCSFVSADFTGHTALEHAIQNKNSILVSFFIKHCGRDSNAEPIIINTDGDTLLHFACRKRSFAMLKFLIEDCHYNQHITNKCNETLMDVLCKTSCSAAKINNLEQRTSEFEILYYLIVSCKFYVNSSEINRDACLHAISIAVCYGKKGLDVCRHLVEECGFKLLAAKQVKIMSQAYWNWDNAEIIKYLIVNMGCAPIIGSSTGDTVLQAVCRKKDLDKIKFLVEECHLNIKNKVGAKLVQIICKSIAPHDFELLYYICIECKCYSELPKHACMAAINYAVAFEERGLPIVRYMVENPGCSSVEKKDQDLIMKFAYSYWQNDMIKCLLLRLKYDGGSMLCKACENGEIEKVKFLVEECNCLTSNPPEILPYPLNFDVLYYLCVECECDHSMFFTADIVSSVVENSSVHTEKSVTFIRRLYTLKLVDTDHVYTIFLAYTNWCSEMIKCLTVELGFDVVYDSHTGDSILHRACEDKNINKLKFLLEECKCNPCVVNKNGDTLLHTVCASFTFSNEDLEIIHYLTKEYECYEMHLSKDALGNTALHLLCDMICHFDDYGLACIDALYYLIKTCKIDANIKNSNGVTILHQLCGKIPSDSHVIKLIIYLIDEGICDPLIMDSFYDTPLHIILRATKKYSPDILSLVYHLLHECKCDITSKNKIGNTPLHVACLNFIEDFTVIEYILSTGKADPLARNNNNQTPLMILHNTTDDSSTLESLRVERLISRFGEVQIIHPIDSYVNVILLGNPGVGKSTLAKVIHDRNKYAFNQFRTVKEVKLHTAGIIPHILNDKDLGRIILHDLAGQAEYYSSHTAVLENLLQGSAAVFIIVVSLTDENFISSLHLWLNIVENVSSNALYRCQLLLVTSHLDQPIGNKANTLNHLKQIMFERINNRNILKKHGVFSLDCRKLGGNSLSNLISALSVACQSINQNNKKEMSLYCHMLYDFFQHCTQNVFTLKSLVDAAKALGSNVIVLPKNIIHVAKILSMISSTGLIVFLRNSINLEESWIVVDKSILLSDLDGALFAPKDFKEHVNIASNTGIIKLSDLNTLFPNYDSELLVQFLQYMELCQIITEKFIISMDIKSLSADDNTDNNQYIFLPALIKDTQKPKIEESFTFGWCLRCTNPHHFFLSRFLHLVLLHLAYKYSVPQSADSKFQRLCKIWTTGIYWKDTKGVQTLVELVDNNRSLVLLMTCKETANNEMIKLIKDVIIEISTCKQQVLPKAGTSEFVIDNSQLNYPLQALNYYTLYNIELLAKCYVNEDQFVLDTTGEIQIAVTNLFPATEVQCYEAIFADRDPKVYIYS